MWRDFSIPDFSIITDGAWRHSAKAKMRLVGCWMDRSATPASPGGGARSGKTFLIIRAIIYRALQGERSRHAILRFHANAARASIALDTLPKVMRLCFPDLSLKERRQDGFFELPNGSRIWIGGLDDKDRVEKILGLEYSTVFLNELLKFPIRPRWSPSRGWRKSRPTSPSGLSWISIRLERPIGRTSSSARSEILFLCSL